MAPLEETLKQEDTVMCFWLSETLTRLLYES